jgi:cyclopropane fatty-acyl-phospholipid synthase-like methyltransferase
MEQKHYIIRGGEEGRTRLRVLSRVMQSKTLSLLDRAGIRPGMECLEVGCGSGDLAFDLARMVGAGGKVVAIAGISAIPNAQRSHTTSSCTRIRHSRGVWIRTLGRGCLDFS